MYWKGMRTTIRSLTKSCRSCQVNKRRSQKYGHLPPKAVYTTPWECLCVDLSGPYTLKGKDNLQIDLMALTMINPASSWFEIAELPVVKQLRWQTVNGKELLIADKIFDKTSECIAKLVNKAWLCRYPWCRHLIYNNGSEFKLHIEYLCESYGITCKLGWEIRSEFRGILQLFQFWTFWTPEFSLEFYFSDRKMCSHQICTRFFLFGILSCHQLFWFHESENVPAINVSGKWHPILIYSTHQIFLRAPSPSHCSWYLLDTHKN